MDSQYIRIGSIATARLLSVDVPAFLPVKTHPVVLRPVEEIVSRLLAMHAIAATLSGVHRARAIRWLEHENLLRFLTQDEVRFLHDRIGLVDKFQWQVEGMWALAWAVGILGGLDFGEECSSHFAMMLPNLYWMENSKRFRTRTIARPLVEVLAMRDLAYCLHWGVREAAPMCPRPSGKLKHYVVVERRRALEWLVCDEDWDAIVLDT